MKPADQHTLLAASRDAFQIEDVYPRIDDGRYAVKRIVGEPVEVWADIYRDGHDLAAARIIWRAEDEAEWQSSPMLLDTNDRWHGSFTPARIGRHAYCIEAWTDEFATWRRNTKRKIDAGQNVDLDAMEGLGLIARVNAPPSEASRILVAHRDRYMSDGDPAILLTDEVAQAMSECQTRTGLTRSIEFPLYVDRERARYGSWYEMIPRSQSATPGKHGTFRDCIARLPDIQAMGFDVLYFTPINPIGVKNRKGRNNSLIAAPNDPGSPYAIGGEAGGHDAIHPELGTLDDFRDLVRAANEHGLEIALDFAVQCSLDHPWLKEHPEWFVHRPDGSIKYAENPPKRYEDIVNPDLSCEDYASLWSALRDVFFFWIDKGVNIFRIDNPHTKSLRFWEWVINEVQSAHPQVLFLSEAFTRPKLMKGLAKLGFTQSYTYFTWRTEKWEIEEYLNELAGYPERDFYRPNFFTNTPDILPYHLQGGDEWMFKSRLALAATLSSTYGIYNGFELLEHTPISGREEYLDSEKYELKTRDWDKPGNIKTYIAAMNRARRGNRALQQTSNLQFRPIDDPHVTGFVKHSPDQTSVVAVAIALAPEPREFWLPVTAKINVNGELRDVTQVENILTGERHWLEWGGLRVRLDPAQDPAILFRCLS